MRPEGNLAGPAFGVRFPSPLGDGWVLARRLPPLDEGQRATCTQRASSTASDAGALEGGRSDTARRRRSRVLPD